MGKVGLTLAMVERIVAAETQKIIPKLQEELREKLMEVFEEREPEMKGETGEDAKPEAVAEVLLKNEEFLEKTKGEKGADADEEKISARIMPVVLEKIPKPIAGPPGPKGPPGPQGRPGKATRGPRGLVGPEGEKPSNSRLLKLMTPLLPTKEKLLALIKPLIKTFEEKFDEKLEVLTKKIQGMMRGSKGARSGGMGNWNHETKNVSSATTTVATNAKIAASGFAIIAYYQSALIMRGTHYTVGGDRQTLTLLFTPQDSTFIDIIYIRT